MMFDDTTTRRMLTPWGIEVKKRLLERNTKQEALLQNLRDEGFDIDKRELSSLLYGVGVSARKRIVVRISEILDIPFQT